MPETHHLSTLDSDVEDGMFGARERLDPYWDGLWVQGSNAVWATQVDTKAQSNAKLIHVPRWARTETTVALDRMFYGREYRRLRTLRMLAAVNEWRTLTFEQLAAVTGDPVLVSTSRNPTAVGDAFAAGLVDMGAFPSIWKRRQGMFRADLIRPARTKVFDRDVAPRLTYPEWVQTTGGVAWMSGGQYDRHNSLATELCLRIAEYCTPDVATVLGELHSSMNLLTASGVSDEFDSAQGKVADATVIRADGVRIAVEITASVSRQFRDKVERWAQLLTNNPWDMTGLMVLFVVAPAPSRADTRGDSVSTEVRRVVAEMAKRYPGSSLGGSGWTAERMAVVQWPDWFPAQHTVHNDFLTMTVQRPTGRNEGVWESASLLDFFDDLPFTPHKKHDPLAVLRNVPWLGGIPHWIRRDLAEQYDTPHLWPLVVNNSGSMTIPYPKQPRHYGDVGTTKFAEPVGGKQAPRPPSRMRLLPVPQTSGEAAA